MLMNFTVPNKSQVIDDIYIDKSKIENTITRLTDTTNLNCPLANIAVLVYEPDSQMSNISGKLLMTPECKEIKPIARCSGVKISILKENDIDVLVISVRYIHAKDIVCLKTKLLTKHDMRQAIRIVDTCKYNSKNSAYVIHYIPTNIEEIQDEEYKEIHGNYPYNHSTKIIVGVNKGRDDSGWFCVDINHEEKEDECFSLAN